jgi:deferrochelatase/peroxidase EfeB
VDNPTEGSSELTGARMIGRWKSVSSYESSALVTTDLFLQGAPIDLAPTQDDLSIAADIQRNQNFTYDHPEIQGFNLSSDQTRCPFSAHMRKTRPRADLGNPTTHQILRAGIPYGPEVTTDEAASNATSIDRGLAFGEPFVSTATAS